MYTPGPPVRDKYWVSLGLNSNGKLGGRACAGLRAGAPDISWPQVGMGPHSLLSNHGQATIIARLGCTRACSAAVGAKAVSTFAGVKFYIFTAGQIWRRDLYDQKTLPLATGALRPTAFQRPQARASLKHIFFTDKFMFTPYKPC